MKPTVFDIEVAPNRAMVGFMDLETGEISQFEHDEDKDIAEYIKDRVLIGYNSKNYDNIILTMMLNGSSTKEIYETSCDLVEGEGKRWHYDNIVENDIDLMEVAPGSASLKLYGARLNAKTIQDLPYNPHEKHSKKMWKNVKKYNKNDLRLTEQLYNFLLPELNLRSSISEKYNIDVMSKGDAQVATSIYTKLLNLRNVKKPSIPKTITYTAPKYLKFKSEQLKHLLKSLDGKVFEINQNNGAPISPKDIENPIINGLEYTVQIGGIHSVNKKTVIEKDDDEIIVDTDVASLYPSLMIQNKFYPDIMGDDFGKLFQKIYKDRQEAKRLSK